MRNDGHCVKIMIRSRRHSACCGLVVAKSGTATYTLWEAKCTSVSPKQENKPMDSILVIVHLISTIRSLYCYSPSRVSFDPPRQIGKIEEDSSCRYFGAGSVQKLSKKNNDIYCFVCVRSLRFGLSQLTQKNSWTSFNQLLSKTGRSCLLI